MGGPIYSSLAQMVLQLPRHGMCVIYVRSRRIACDLSPEVFDPSLFFNLGKACHESSRIISGFTDIRIVLKWGFIQAGAGVISNT